jgi:hypothetical protein
MGFEILDNMPHDRLYSADHPSVLKPEKEVEGKDSGA